MKLSDMPICTYGHEDCAACRSGHCVALKSVHFKRDTCPFYKSKEQNAAERLAAEQRLEAIGYCGEIYDEC